jgi:hypothetical protein
VNCDPGFFRKIIFTKNQFTFHVGLNLLAVSFNCAPSRENRRAKIP